MPITINDLEKWTKAINKNKSPSIVGNTAPSDDWTDRWRKRVNEAQKWMEQSSGSTVPVRFHASETPSATPSLDFESLKKTSTSGFIKTKRDDESLKNKDGGELAAELSAAGTKPLVVVAAHHQHAGGSFLRYGKRGAGDAQEEKLNETFPIAIAAASKCVKEAGSELIYDDETKKALEKRKVLLVNEIENSSGKKCDAALVVAPDLRKSQYKNIRDNEPQNPLWDDYIKEIYSMYKNLCSSLKDSGPNQPIVLTLPGSGVFGENNQYALAIQGICLRMAFEEYHELKTRGNIYLPHAQSDVLQAFNLNDTGMPNIKNIFERVKTATAPEIQSPLPAEPAAIPALPELIQGGQPAQGEKPTEQPGAKPGPTAKLTDATDAAASPKNPATELKSDTSDTKENTPPPDPKSQEGDSLPEFIASKPNAVRAAGFQFSCSKVLYRATQKCKPNEYIDFRFSQQKQVSRRSDAIQQFMDKHTELDDLKPQEKLKKLMADCQAFREWMDEIGTWRLRERNLQNFYENLSFPGRRKPQMLANMAHILETTKLYNGINMELEKNDKNTDEHSFILKDKDGNGRIKGRLKNGKMTMETIQAPPTLRDISIMVEQAAHHRERNPSSDTPYELDCPGSPWVAVRAFQVAIFYGLNPKLSNETLQAMYKDEELCDQYQRLQKALNWDGYASPQISNARRAGILSEISYDYFKDKYDVDIKEEPLAISAGSHAEAPKDAKEDPLTIKAGDQLEDGQGVHALGAKLPIIQKDSGAEAKENRTSGRTKARGPN